MTNNIYLLLGGNLGDVQSIFSQCKMLIEKEIGSILHSSKLYQSEPWGFKSSNLFLNQVLHVSTSKTAFETLAITQNIELKLGRTRNPNASGFQSRVIDIDLLYVNNEVIETEVLKIPHYALHERMFTLKPLAEIAPNFEHPIYKESNTALLEKCQDKSEVTSI
ncbi:MAG: 2-amino-4-hydroxy-6-hydroxymethyldihydropteridine diphosphokinase [Salibacteraceae bacterium]